jgi:hypothetical protein
MLATGGSLLAAIDYLFARGAVDVTAVCLIGAPEGLEANLECYLKLLMRYVLLPRLRIAMAAFHFGILDGLAQITLSPTTTVPHNPAVEDDMLKLFVDVEVGP